MARQHLEGKATPLCHLVTQRGGRVVGETVLFPGSVHSFRVEGEEGEEVRVGECFVGLDREQTASVQRFMEDECFRINERGRADDTGLEAEFISYG
jgi:hypothetical protein